MNRTLVALSAVCVPMLSVAAPPSVEPVDVNVTNPVVPVEVSNADPIPVSVVTGGISNNQFTLPPLQGTLAPAGGDIAPDPSGTQYAITSLTLTNPSAEAVTFIVKAVATEGASNNTCRFVFNQQDTTNGPEVIAPPHDTAHITFPQPFVTTAVSGNNVCLVVSANPAYIGVKWSAVGYKILP